MFAWGSQRRVVGCRDRDLEQRFARARPELRLVPGALQGVQARADVRRALVLRPERGAWQRGIARQLAESQVDLERRPLAAVRLNLRQKFRRQVRTTDQA